MNVPITSIVNDERLLKETHFFCLSEIIAGCPVGTPFKIRCKFAHKRNDETLKINYLGAQKNPQKSVNFILPIQYKCDRLVAESIIREE